MIARREGYIERVRENDVKPDNREIDFDGSTKAYHSGGLMAPDKNGRMSPKHWTSYGH
jgi:hypothetical protein